MCVLERESVFFPYSPSLVPSPFPVCLSTHFCIFNLCAFNLPYLCLHTSRFHIYICVHVCFIHINTLCYILFCLYLFVKQHLRPTHVAKYRSSYLFLTNAWYSIIYHILLICSPSDRHLDCFHLFAIIVNTAKNTYFTFENCGRVSLGCMPKN